MSSPKQTKYVGNLLDQCEAKGWSDAANDIVRQCTGGKTWDRKKAYKQISVGACSEIINRLKQLLEDGPPAATEEPTSTEVQDVAKKAEPEKKPEDNSKVNKTQVVKDIRAEWMASHNGEEPKPRQVYEKYKVTSASTGSEEKDIGYITTTLSQIRKKEKDAADTQPSRPVTGEMGVTELMALMDDLGGEFDQVAAACERIQQLAQKYGGVERLATGVAGIQKFQRRSAAK